MGASGGEPGLGLGRSEGGGCGLSEKVRFELVLKEKL